MLIQWRTCILIMLVSLLALLYLGIWLCVVLSTLSIAFLTGVALVINNDTVTKEEHKKDVLFELRLPNNDSQGFTRGLTMVDNALQERIKTKPHEYHLQTQGSRELTRIKQLDDVINNMIELCMVYFIQGWYSKLNHDQAFLVKTRLLIERCVVSGSDRIRSADWFMFLTRKILLEVVTHIRLYKTAQQRMLAQSLRRQEKQDESSKIKSIEDWFFWVEQEQTDDSFQAICTNPECESEYQKKLIDILMLHLMPQEEYDCVLLRDLLKEVLTLRVVTPAINYAANPNTINYIIHTRAPGSLNSKALVKYLESAYIPDTDLNCVITFLDKEIQDLTRKGSSDREHSHLESLKGLKKYCKRHLKQLIEESAKLEPSSTTISKGRAMQSLLYNVVISDQVMDFLGRSKETRREALFLEDVLTFANTYKFVDASDGENTQYSMREKAMDIFTTYLTNSSNTCVQLDSRIIANLSRTFSDYSQTIGPDLFKEAVENVCSRLQEQGAHHAFLNFYEPQISGYEDSLLSPVHFSPLDYSNIVLECSMIKCSVSDYTIEPEPNPLIRPVVQYKLDIECFLEDGLSHQWTIQKKYSDFDAFHKGIIEHGIYLPPDLTLPQKFGLFTSSTQVLAEGRRRAIEAYLSRLLDLIRALPGLRDDLAKFLVPLNHFDVSANKLSDQIQDDDVDTNSDSNQLIKRILELMREIFDLRTEDDRSLYISLNSIILQSLIKSTQAEKLHRKLYEQYTEYTDPSFLAVLLTILTNSIWPQGIFRGLSVPPPDKHSDIRKQRVEILARLHLLNSVPEELVTLLNSKVTDKGMNRMFDLIQRAELNKRFIYVIIESALEFLLPNTVVKQEFTQLRSEFSERTA
ncbi:Sorting nexin-13 isoform X3 [Oopsacas minuta]|uniref:Sorting nexin-13 isoform X3 n=1 Tax=Oopsacas minuta TaxID=111878 RepID=A0AAV7K250_9METZ|nr:Sorting nexin-13 isoform X3 [Oopsacas minuta]